jgi:hypothetical protein
MPDHADEKATIPQTAQHTIAAYTLRFLFIPILPM